MTQVVPFEMVDDILATTGTVQARIRDLPSRVVVYLLLAAGLFAECGYRQVWARLTSGLDGLAVAAPTSSALAQARRRNGVKPLAALFALICETTFLELKSTTLGGRVLRARTPAGIDQEVYALLTGYQALRLAMTSATDHDPDITPDRASFTIALNTARDQIIHAADVIADTVIDLVGNIGRAILHDPLPERRARISPRVVKRAISEHRTKGDIDRTNHNATITITLGLTASPAP